MTEPYQAEVTKIKTKLWNAQHIIKNAKANLCVDGEEWSITYSPLAEELQAALHKLADVETLVGALHRDIVEHANQNPIASYTR